MIQASTLIDDIRRELQPVVEELLRHPYVAAFEAGSAPREQLRLFAGEQFHIITSDLRSVAHLVTRFGASSSRDLCLAVLQGERTALDGLHALAGALGLSETDLQDHEPLPGAHAYTCYMAWLALYGSDAEVAAAYLVNFPAWGRNCGRMGRILQEQYGLSETDVAFFELFAAPPAEFEPGALAVIQDGLNRCVDRRLVRRAARLLQAYEALYWDTLAQASIGSSQ